MARRRYQKGSLRLRKTTRGEYVWDGRWLDDIVEAGQVRRVHRRKVLGTRKQFPTAKLARRELERFLYEVNKASYRPTPVATFEEFSERWSTDVLKGWKRSSAVNARSHLKKHLVPFFGRYPLRDVWPEDTQRFVASLTVGGKTARNITMTLRSLWSKAIAFGYVTQDIFKGVELPRTTRRDPFFFTVEQAGMIVAATSGLKRAFYWLAAETGFRAGELCGLRTEDLDIATCTVRIRRSVWRGSEQAPKSHAGFREALISQELIAHLVTCIPTEPGLLFATSNGTPWHADLLRKRHLKPLVAKLGIVMPRGSGLHSFRHALATEMDRKGVPLAVRIRRLGHTDARLTIGTYTHAVDDDERQFVQELGRALNPQLRAEAINC